MGPFGVPVDRASQLHAGRDSAAQDTRPSLGALSSRGRLDKQFGGGALHVHDRVVHACAANDHANGSAAVPALDSERGRFSKIRCLIFEGL